MVGQGLGPVLGASIGGVVYGRLGGTGEPLYVLKTDAAANTVAENAANGTVVGITALASDAAADANPAAT